jgi:hypothetical protein
VIRELMWYSSVYSSVQFYEVQWEKTTTLDYMLETLSHLYTAKLRGVRASPLTHSKGPLNTIWGRWR